MKKPNIFKRTIKKFLNIPHLFGKLTIVFCIAFVAFCSVYCLRIEATTAKSPASLLGVIIGFFGTELCMMLFKTIFDKKKPKTKNNEDTTDDYSENSSSDDDMYSNF